MDVRYDYFLPKIDDRSLVAAFRYAPELLDTEIGRGFPPDGHAWLVTLKYEGRKTTTPFFGGSAVKKPKAKDVICAMITDAVSYENSRNFEDWASEYGYDTDSRKARRLYSAIREQTKKIKHLLGDDYDRFVKECEDY